MKFAVALTVLASLVAAAPTEKRAEGGPYNVEITYTRPQNVTEHSLANARLRTMFKYSHGLKPEERAALETEIHEHAKRFNIPITSIVDRSYSASIGFG
jgi:hypothetical protein